jgi:hypothetical protein
MIRCDFCNNLAAFCRYAEREAIALIGCFNYDFIVSDEVRQEIEKMLLLTVAKIKKRRINSNASTP